MCIRDSYYTYTECVDATEGIPIGGTATKFTSEFSRVYSTSSSYYYKFKLWQRGTGKTYTLVASTGTINYQTGVVEHTLTGSQWTNLPADLYIGGYFYRGYIYYYSGAPYSGNGDRNYYYYSSERTGTFSNWYGPRNSFAIPFRVWMSGAGASASDVKFRYRIGDHALVKVNEADLRGALCEACHGQEFVAKAPVSLVFAAVYRRTTKRYAERGERYVHIDVGHAAQNVHLEAVALGLGSVPVGAFDDQAVARALGLPGSHAPLYIVTVGHPT